jgi:pantoate--beta-alanine ligase
MSSRNSYLNLRERAAATVLSRALRAGQAAVSDAPDGDANAVRAAMREVVAGEPLATLDYADVCDPDTFEPLATMRTPALLAIAARIGHTRLIDNFLLKASGGWETGHGVES